jgi:cytochrome c'
MKIRTMLGIGACFCAAAVFGPPRTDLRADEGGKVKLIGSAKDVAKLIDEDSAELQKALSAAKPALKDQKRARMLAVVIALNSKALGGNGAATLEQAAKVAEALAKGDDGLADAKAAAGALTTAKTPGSGTQGDPVKTLWDSDPNTKDWDRGLAMQLFRAARIGGMGIEGKIKVWAEKAPAGKDMDLAASFAQKSAVVGMVLQQMSPPKDKKVPADDWKKFAKNLTAASEDAMKAAKSGNEQAIKTAYGRVLQSCVACHDVAKD